MRRLDDRIRIGAAAPAEIKGDAMKLWTVTVEIEFACLAETEQEACRFADTAMDDCGSLTWYALARENTTGVLPDGWENEDDLVYHSGKEDITFAKAVEMTAPPFADERQLRLEMPQELQS